MKVTAITLTSDDGTRYVVAVDPDSDDIHIYHVAVNGEPRKVDQIPSGGRALSDAVTTLVLTGETMRNRKAVTW